MREDENGWWGVPAGKIWECPECHQQSPAELWDETEVSCELCGGHDARRCPHCETSIDFVYDRIIQSSIEVREVIA